MESNRLAARAMRPLAVFAAFCGFAALPASAQAAEGENVVLAFDRMGQGTLLAAFLVGLLTLLYGLLRLWPFVKRQSPGNDEMQRVGLAIKEGAIAYLKRQLTTMVPLVVLLAAGLVGLNWRLGTGTALGVGLCFVLGVAASYVSGTVGMLVAVNGNMRTANAALEGYRKSLVVAFRSGAVAGMVTVGIGLMGASAILGLFPKIATSLLIGFAFGASLAALFMRVGGGIFTKAADVGADLVGKVEAGIPEDDPRNPAVIADNVGDNVGDCAGMAADVFESYEVTLIAAIVLGAATAAIFDAQTWPRLIVFGLAVSALGLVASAIGVELVNAKDDPKSDPLKSLKRGFYIAIGVTVLGVLGIAATTMNGIGTSRLRATAEIQQDEVRLVKRVRQELASAKGVKPTDVLAADILKDPRLAQMGFRTVKDEEARVTNLANAPVRPEGAISSLAGFQPVDLAKPDQPFLDYAVQVPPSAENPVGGFQTIRSIVDGTGDKALVVGRLHIVAKIPATPASESRPAQVAQDLDTYSSLGPIPKGELDRQVATFRTQAKQNNIQAKIEVAGEYPVRLYASPDGRLAYGIDGQFPHPAETRGNGAPLQYFKATVPEMQQLSARPATPREQGLFDIGLIQREAVPWWKFASCVLFGILLAFVIEYITDYFVSTDKKPTQEVAGVATAGAAPMVIQGFAHALTSSVYMTLAIGGSAYYSRCSCSVRRRTAATS